MAERADKKAAATIGRVVRYVIHEGEERAAIIAGVADAEKGELNLSVFKNAPGDLVNYPAAICGTGMGSAVTLVGSVAFDEKGQAAHSWHWPARDE